MKYIQYRPSTHTLLLCLVIIEIICLITVEFTFLKDLKTVLFFISGLSIGIIPIIFQPNKKTTFIGEKHLWITAFMATLMLFSVEYFRVIISELPIDFRIADMLPVIQTMNQRLIDWQDPYMPINEIWGGIQPIYLPAMWLAYLPSEIFSFDMRWLSLFFIMGALWLLLYLPRRLTLSSIYVVIPISLLVTGLISLDTRILSMTQEGVVMFYYTFLSWAIFRKNPYAIGIASGLCLMSRYTLALWLLFFVFWIYKTQSRTFFLRSVMSIMVCIMILMTLGKAWYHLPLFLGLEDHYLQSAIENPDKYIEVAQSGLGLVRFFPVHQWSMLHQLFILSAFILPVIFIFLTGIFKNRASFSCVAMSTLKICMTLFFGLLIIPYPYLFYPSIFISLALYIAYVNSSPKIMTL